MNYTIDKDFFGKFDWGCYMEGYKDAAILLLESLPANQNETNRNKILPTLFLIRHFLELSFKEILYHEYFINKTKDLETNHYLKTLWNKVKPKIERIFKENQELKNNKYLFPYKSKLKNINNLVVFFENHDPESFSFRYPKDKRLKKSTVPNKIEIDLEELKTDFKIVQSFLSNFIIYH